MRAAAEIGKTMASRLTAPFTATRECRHGSLWHGTPLMHDCHRYDDTRLELPAVRGGVVRNRTSVDLKTEYLWGLEWLSSRYHIVTISASLKAFRIPKRLNATSGKILRTR